jgi:hypothetical protein
MFEAFDRPSEIEWVLAELHEGTWFAFKEDGESKDREHTYENLVIMPVNGVTHPKPAKEFLESELAAAQERWDKAQYKRDRKVNYKPLPDQLDMLFWDMENGTTNWQSHIRDVKARNPKP